MTPSDITTALQSTTTATQERIILRQAHDHIRDYLATHDPRWLDSAIERCTAGERRGGEKVETFWRLRARVQLFEATGLRRLLTEAIDTSERSLR